jgi:hypothetical protein
MPGICGSADGTNQDARFDFPHRIAADSAGNLYVADSQTVIRKVARIGTNWVVSTIAGLAGVRATVDGTNSDARFFDIEGITVDSTGTLFVTDIGSYNLIRQVALVGPNWVVTTLLTAGWGSADGTNQAAQFQYVEGIARDYAGNF